jgi:hypothetical protein
VGATGLQAVTYMVENMHLPPPLVSDSAPVGSGWRTVSFVSSILTLCCLICVAVSSRTIGRPTWWLGPSSNPAPVFFILLPAALVVIPLVATFRQSPQMPLISAVCALSLMATAIPDITSTPAIALTVVVIGFAGLLQSIALVVVTRHYR